MAESDNDLDGAITYYKRALSFDPGNEELQQNLMLALISKGDFKAALPYAEKLKNVAGRRAVLAPGAGDRRLSQEGLPRRPRTG